MKTQILTALLVLAMMMGTGTVMAEDHIVSDDAEYLGVDFGNHVHSPGLGLHAPVCDSPIPYVTNPLGDTFGYEGEVPDKE